MARISGFSFLGLERLACEGTREEDEEEEDEDGAGDVMDRPFFMGEPLASFPLLWDLSSPPKSMPRSLLVPLSLPRSLLVFVITVSP